MAAEFIRVRLLKDTNQSIALLKNLKMRTASGAVLPLSAIASIGFGSGPTTIQRHDRQRHGALQANLNGIALGEALEKIHALPAIKKCLQT